MPKISIDLQSGSVSRSSGEIIVGIDLGTTNSLLAFVQNGIPQAVIFKEEESALLPSIVHFSSTGEMTIGKKAAEKLVTDPSHTVYSAKRLLGKSSKDVESIANHLGYKIVEGYEDNLLRIKIFDKFYSPIEISAAILRELKHKSESELGARVTKAVITVPAYFNDAQRQATRDAGKLAGLDVLRIVNEPTAASLAYGLGKTEAETIAVYDLGGGTFDISILQIQDGVFEVLATNGDTFLGGDDFDRALVGHWLHEMAVASDELEPTQLQELRLLAETAKKTLSNEEEFEGRFDDKILKINRLTFESLILPKVEKTIECCRMALKDARLSIQQIQHVVMVGGSTRVPLVKRLVSSFFRREVYDKLDPDQVVALGAAIQADVLAGNQKDVLLLDITPLSLGIETVGGLMDTIIPRNSKVPTKAARQYTTSVDGQRNLKIAVFQGERDLVADNRKLGEFILKGIPPMPAGLPKIEVQFTINADGILKVNARELRSGLEQAIHIKPAYGITEEQMAKMLLDSVQHAESDIAARALLEAKNEANHILLATNKFLEQNQTLLSGDEANAIRNLASKLEEAARSDDKDAINEAISQINEYSKPLAHRAMDAAVLQAMKGQKL